MAHKFSPISLGKSLTKIETGGFVLTETKHQPVSTLARHNHQQPNMACVIGGSFTETISSRSYECVSHSLLIKPAEEVHSNRYGKAGAHCLIIELPSPRLYDLDCLSDTFNEVRHFQAGVLFALVMQIRRELRTADSISGLAIEGLVLELMARSIRRSHSAPQTIEPRWLREARDFIHAHFNQQVSLSVVAEFVGVHPAHLARMFRRHYRYTVGEYVRRLRLDHAAQQMTRTDEPLAEIAASVGFYDQSHFTHTFRLHTGMTPAEYRTATCGRKAVTKKL
jgi:AraC family transcriptional regulator